MRWQRRWQIAGSNGKTWVVSIDEFGNFGCSCPDWIYRRHECKHIVHVRLNEKNIVVEYNVFAPEIERKIHTAPEKKRKKSMPIATARAIKTR